MERLRLQHLCIFLLVLLSGSSCAYRFSNLQSPAYALKSIAIEGVYDTSAKVLPHQIMWLEMQKAFVRDGRLRLTSPKEADALVLMHITSASMAPFGSVVDQDRTTKNKSSRIDPKMFEGGEPPLYADLKNLTRAGEIADKESLEVQVDVRIVDLRSQQVLLRRAYSMSEVFASIDNIGDPLNEFLNYEEKLSSDFKRISQNLASRVIQDFFISH